MATIFFKGEWGPAFPSNSPTTSYNGHLPLKWRTRQRQENDDTTPVKFNGFAVVPVDDDPFEIGGF